MGNFMRTFGLCNPIAVLIGVILLAGFTACTAYRDADRPPVMCTVITPNITLTDVKKRNISTYLNGMIAKKGNQTLDVDGDYSIICEE